MTTKTKFLAGLCALALSVAGTSSTSAETFRPDPLKILVPFAAGGVVDQVTRTVGNALAEQLGSTVIIDNRGGAGGEFAVSAATQAAPDGKTVLFHTSSHVINPTLKGKAKEIASAFEPLARIGAVKFVLVVKKDLPAKSLTDLVALAKSGTNLTFGSTGPGTTLHIAGEMVNDELGLKAVHVPYRGLGPAFNDLVAGNIDFIVTSVGGVLPYVKAGQVRAIATFDADRAEQLPDIPTTVELGYKNLTISNWFGFFAAANVPADRRQHLEKALVEVLSTPKMQTQLNAAGLYGVQDAAQFKKSVDAEFLRWPALLQRLKITATK
jgi:tripartite-type tricarboxylate transporter receptor subunit TctC